ncbi:MAG: hypothetical protein ACR2L8_10835 [Solirubrobacteraceae bacterium]
MPTRIVFAAGESLLVDEDADAVVKGLEDISPGRADLLKLTRTTGHADADTVEGMAVHVRPASILYVIEA